MQTANRPARLLGLFAGQPKPRLYNRASEAGYDTRTAQELLGHSDVRTTMISTHILNRGGRGVRSPADFDDYVSE